MTQSRAGMSIRRRSRMRDITARRATPGVVRIAAVMNGNIDVNPRWRGPLKLRDVAHSTKPSTIDRWRCHVNCAIGPPIEYPTAVKRGTSSNSASAATSSAQSANRKCRVRMPCPCPR